MMDCITLVIATALISSAAEVTSVDSGYRTTSDRISEHKYPVETHNVHTSDGYILTLFRIPYSPRRQNQNERRPATFLQHGLISSSDCWILNDPDNGLPYLLADAGYDVWFGNGRGNTYSKHHETLSPSQSSFWDFSFHEIAIYDVSASIDYILNTTSESGLHYVGHSMGTTVFFVLMSVKPEYNAKVKTAHMLAPVGFLNHTGSPFDIFVRPFVRDPSNITDIENTEVMPHNEKSARLLTEICADTSPLRSACLDLHSFATGWNSTHFNKTLLLDIIETHPAGASSNTFIHFGQGYASGYFRWYDHGSEENLRRYKQITPPNYNLSSIVAPVRLYYSDNDFVADVDDVKRIEDLLPNVVESFHVPYPDWNHVDFLFAIDVKETIFDRILDAAKNFEATGNQ